MALAHPDGERMSERARQRAFLTVLAAFVLDVMDSTIVTVAVPDIQTDMHLSNAAVQWSVAGYFLSFAVLLVAGGRLGDIYGHRRLFLAGIASFTLASIGCGLARDAEQLVGARVLQGVAASLMAPQVMAIVQILYSPSERIGRLAFFGVLGGLAAILGPIVGGILIKADILGLGWRMVFLINLPIGVIGLAAGWRYLPRREPGGAGGLDLVGIGLLAGILLLVLVPLIDGRERGWPWWSFGCMALAVPGIALFFVQQARRQRLRGDALMAPSIFRNRGYTLGLLALVFFATATGGFFMPLMLTLQGDLGFSAFQAAMLHVPFAGGVMIGIAGLGRRFLPRFGKYVVIVGAGAMALAVLGLSFSLGTSPGSVAVMLMWLALAGVGMGMVSGPLAPLALARVDTAVAGVASGAFKSTQQIGGAVGAALIGTLFFMRQDATHSAILGMTRAAEVIAASLVVVALLALMMPRSPFAVDEREVSHKYNRYSESVYGSPESDCLGGIIRWFQGLVACWSVPPWFRWLCLCLRKRKTLRRVSNPEAWVRLW
jgi:EmrB/QacA subfamily drug resistance transporter